jgi:hypothetical protein
LQRYNFWVNYSRFALHKKQKKSTTQDLTTFLGACWTVGATGNIKTKHLQHKAKTSAGEDFIRYRYLILVTIS